MREERRESAVFSLPVDLSGQLDLILGDTTLNPEKHIVIDCLCSPPKLRLLTILPSYNSGLKLHRNGLVQ